jgi:hypothetical protein
MPADEGTVYITAGNAAAIDVRTAAGFTNPITVTFPRPIDNFFLTVLNGNTLPVTFQVADNVGNSATFLLAPNMNRGASQIGFAATGTVVTIGAVTGQSTATGMTWDFAIDHIHFNQPLPAGLRPRTTTSAPPLPSPPAPAPPTLATPHTARGFAHATRHGFAHAAGDPAGEYQFFAAHRHSGRRWSRRCRLLFAARQEPRSCDPQRCSRGSE